MLGTGYATATRCYNTCFAIEHSGHYLLTDAGGGNGILLQLTKAGIAMDNISGMFLTHAHTDHLLGAVWVVRAVAQRMTQNAFVRHFSIFGNDKVIQALEQICRMTLPRKMVVQIGQGIKLSVVDDGEIFQTTGLSVQCFDILSTKEKQYGYRILDNGCSKLVCLGDEPFNTHNRPYVEDAEWLMCEAFCLHKDKDMFRPYEKHHSTAMDAGRVAQQLGVRNLLLYHTEDTALDLRKQRYTEEAAQVFKGNIWVPDDLETIEL